MCKLCWGRKWRQDNLQHDKDYHRRWYLKQGGNLYSKLLRENKHFDGLRETILKRDGYRCQMCGSPYKLVVHHKDGNGRGSKSPNNTPENLITLCKACHINEHRMLLQSASGFIHGAKWSPKYGLEACRECKRSDVIHNAGGYCANCYALKRYKDNSEMFRQRTRDWRARKKLKKI